MPKKKHQFKDKNANKKQKLLYDNSASEHSILRINQPSLMLDKMICLTDSIYGSSVPKGLEGYLFCYKVVGYESEKQRFKATFQLRIIEDDGHEWKHMDGEREELDGLTYICNPKNTDRAIQSKVLTVFTLFSVLRMFNFPRSTTVFSPPPRHLFCI